MATFRIPILGSGTVPDNSGDVFFEPASIKATNKVWGYLIAIFNDTANRDGLRGSFTVPQNYVSGAILVIVWTSTSSTGSAVWDFDYRAVGGDGTESLDQVGVQESVTVTDATALPINERREAAIALTDANFAPGDTVQFELFRDGTAADTIAAALQVHGLLFSYNDV